MRAPKKFFYADPHFGHRKVIEYENRPFKDMDEMHHSLIKKWNSTVEEQDNIFVVGDFSFSGAKETEEILKQLKGRKHLILGDHDWATSMTKWQSMGFLSVYQQAVLHLQKDVQVKLCHFPYTDIRYLDFRPVKEENMWLIHGHQHGHGLKFDSENKMICVSVEQWNYKPVSEDEVLGIIKSRISQ